MEKQKISLKELEEVQGGQANSKVVQSDSVIDRDFNNWFNSFDS